MLQYFLFRPIAEKIGTTEYKGKLDKATRALMIVHAPNQGQSDRSPHLFALYQTPMAAWPLLRSSSGDT